MATHTTHATLLSIPNSRHPDDDTAMHDANTLRRALSGAYAGIAFQVFQTPVGWDVVIIVPTLPSGQIINPQKMSECKTFALGFMASSYLWER